MTVKISFLGGAGTVTGSKYLLESEGRRILVDCGLFQGFKQLRLRNWAPFPVPPASIDQILLTHAHIDHSGYIPLLVRNGFRGTISCIDATMDLCGLLLPDCGHLQERDAEFANRRGFSKHKPALPLYTQADAEKSLERFRPVSFRTNVPVAGGLTARFLYAGHILGAAMIELTRGDTKILFSGDLGRPKDISLFDPDVVEAADYLIVESTYGNRSHGPLDPEDALAEAIQTTVARGGTILIPAFAVGRTQSLLLHLYRLKQANRIPDLPIYVDSPMAIDATEIFAAHSEDHRIDPAETRAAFGIAHYVRTIDESKRLDAQTEPKLILSASGMATGGRVLHHLETYAPEPKNLILFSGFQAGGTRGAAMTEGAETIKMHGRYIPVRAQVQNLQMLSAHADADEIMAWLRHFRSPPKMTFVTHGEPAAADALRHRIDEELGWACTVPDYRDEAELI
ncbi:MAG TPA: MBL fold metallo-hydrolase [Micropepsaceae bacterium]|jgi:metallo-beta-lactamase family protein|nr:MBL fold metallo-hydrolase [Micropepsaceae bacterium]